jgi:hypothetical protein
LSTQAEVHSKRALILAPRGRDAAVAAGILQEAGLAVEICNSLVELQEEMDLGAGVAVLTDEAIFSADLKGLAGWIASVGTRRRLGAEPFRYQTDGNPRQYEFSGKTLSSDHARQRSENGVTRTAAAV